MNSTINQLDLKMLRVLLTLAHTRNTYRAAEELNLSQSAVSRALGRLRDILGDPLFVSSNRGLEPTAFTERVVARLPEVFDLITEVVQGDKGFNPLEWQGNVSIALSSLTTYCWGDELYARLSEQAPNVLWSFQTWRSHTVSEILDGRVAMGIHFENPSWPQALYQERVVEDHYVLMARKGHKALRGKPSMTLFERFPLISLLLPDWNDYDNRLEAEVLANGIRPRVSLRTDNMGLAINSLRKGDALMAGTRTLAEHLPPDIEQLEYPAEMQAPGSGLVMCYPRRMRESSRYRWFWEQVHSVASGN